MSDKLHSVDHNYHLVNPSPWPVLGALSAFLLACGLVAFMHVERFNNSVLQKLDLWLIVPGILGILYTMWFWWKDVIAEAHQGHHTAVVQLGLRYGMILFIISEAMFFIAFFWAFFNASLFQTWPPEGIESIAVWDLPLLLTLILLLSGTTVTWAHHSVLDHTANKDLTAALGLTVLLGIIFILLQFYEYSHASFSFTEGIFASTFYMTTGFHGFHVLVGTIFLFICYVRARRVSFRTDQHFGLEAAAWYWHFVDVVWLYLFVCVYWLST